ncbi:MAG: bifunctional riboflavin kinase/FAD synthetase [Lachnospiraceae bacterium]|nr:bifunctional riboflavin kinase/FAD synthetase [Lachnospiraceae bacterium]
MVTINNITECRIEKSAVALGKFDGIHLGHQAILNELKKNISNDTKTVVITFSVSPEAVLSKKQLQYIMTEEEKNDFFMLQDIDYLIDIKLDADFLKLEASEFIEKYLVQRLGVKKIVCGQDFHFGKNRSGDVPFLKKESEKYGFSVSVVSPVTISDTVISSTKIREELRNGNIPQVNQMLGHPYFLKGTVVHGQALGRTIDFPTINLWPAPDKLLPPYGVYNTECIISGIYFKSITNIGKKPTVSNQEKLSIETHILDFTGDLYGQVITLLFRGFIRSEKKFNSIKELRQQIVRDIASVKTEQKRAGLTSANNMI